MGLARQEETLEIRLADAHVFTATPHSAAVELDPGLAVYSAAIRFSARFDGVRWLMYHWRLSSFLVFVVLFWAVELASAAALWYWVEVWLEFRAARAELALTGTRIRDVPTEDDTEGPLPPRFEDTQRTFPTSSRAPALRPAQGYLPTPEGTPAPESLLAEEWTPESGDSRVGDDEDDEDTTEYDEEDEDVVALPSGRSDSGIGTSESTGRRSGETESMRQRRQRMGRGRGYTSYLGGDVSGRGATGGPGR